ncbi:DNA polymerase IIIc chi subunit [Bradyrhizobium sp. USDA 3051]
MRSTPICGPIATIPSCRTRHGGVSDAADQPIVLAVEEDNPNGANVRFLVDNAALPQDAQAYERIVLLFDGDDPDALAFARSAWTDCKARGFDVTYWQADERGRWQKRN